MKNWARHNRAGDRMRAVKNGIDNKIHRYHHMIMDWAVFLQLRTVVRYFVRYFGSYPISIRGDEEKVTSDASHFLRDLD